MADITIDVRDNDVGEVKATLELELEETTSEVEEVIGKYALLIARDAKKNAPVDTGRLRASIRADLEETAARIMAGGSFAGSSVVYAAVQEFGNKEGGIEGKKYMTRAMKKHEDDFKRDLREALEDFGS